ncbi:MAG: hypothetical protein JWL71_3084 [Acidobacteria bacterium]|nr:hypothetical protein [Acidobacteriota bacterium]
MKQKCLFSWSALALLVTTGCTQASPTRPSAVSATGTTAVVIDAVTGVTLTVPSPVTPTVNQQFNYAEQPLTLTVKNAVSTGTTALTYGFEVASDATFANKVYAKDGIPEGSGRTSVKIDVLPGPAAKTYFWRARAMVGSQTGPYTPVQAFGVGAAVTLGTPVQASPGAGATVGGQPTLTVNNVARTGQPGQIVYRFEVAASSAFTSLLAVATVNEQGGSTTSATVSASLANGDYFWRVQASDPANSVTTAFSAVSPFTVQLFDLQKANIWDNPPDFKSWAETAAITSVDFTDDAILVDFDKRDGPNRWPDVGFGSGALEYTLGMCVNIRGTWNCSATVQFWYGRDLAASGLPSYIAANWWYDARWGALQGYQPTCGETVGIYAAAGNLRDSGNVIAKERTNIVMMPFCGQYRAGAGVIGVRTRK